jgi:hypothetical protein
MATSMDTIQSRDTMAMSMDSLDVSVIEQCGEGGDNGEITPGKSLVFATMEVCLCIIVRQIPSMNPAAPISTGFQTPKHTTLSEESSKLIAAAMNIMTELPALCTPTGKIYLHFFSTRLKMTLFNKSRIYLYSNAF